MAAPEKKKITAREGAYQVLMQVATEGAYANLALKKLLDHVQMRAEDARLAAQIVYGTVRCRYALDYILSGLLTRPIDQLKPEVLVILRLSLYQLHYLEKAEPYAVVDEGVKLAKAHANIPLSKLVNGVLRSYLRKLESVDKASLLPGKQIPRRYLHVTLSYPLWMAEYFLERFGWADAERFCLLQNQHPGLILRANTLRTDREALLQILAEHGIMAQAAGYAPETVLVKKGSGNLASFPPFRDGLFLMQGAASQMVAHALLPRPGERILDLCAAPGGKTTHLAALMENKGEIHAFDQHAHKIPLIEENLRRLGVRCVQTHTADSGALGEEYREWADKILLDAPCSGLGVLNDRPDSRYHKQAEDIPQLAKAAYGLLHAASGYLKPGGQLCYSTCTVTHEENEDNILRFLTEHSEFHLIPLAGIQPFLPENERAAAESGMYQFLPQRLGTEGFFLALLEKSKEKA